MSRECVGGTMTRDGKGLGMTINADRRTSWRRISRVRRGGAAALSLAGLWLLLAAPAPPPGSFTFTQVAGPFTYGGLGSFAKVPGQVVFSPKGTLLVSNTGTAVWVQKVSKAGVVGPPLPRSINPGYSFCKYPKGFPIGSLRGGPFDSVAFSLPGGLLAEVADPDTRPVRGEPKGGSLHIYRVRGTKFLKGSCLTLSGSGYHVAFGPLGLLAVTNAGNDTVTLYRVTGAGKTHQLSVLPTGKGPEAVAFGPTQGGGEALAVANGGDNTVSTFTVYGTVVAPAAGSPFPTAAGPDSVAFSPKGLLAVAGSTANLVYDYSVSYTGALSGVGGGHASDPMSVAFSTTGRLLGSADTSDVSVFSVATSGLLAPAFTVPTGASSITFDHHAFLFAIATSKGTEVYRYAFPRS